MGKRWLMPELLKRIFKSTDCAIGKRFVSGVEFSYRSLPVTTEWRRNVILMDLSRFRMTYRPCLNLRTISGHRRLWTTVVSVVSKQVFGTNTADACNARIQMTRFSTAINRSNTVHFCSHSVYRLKRRTCSATPSACVFDKMAKKNTANGFDTHTQGRLWSFAWRQYFLYNT